MYHQRAKMIFWGTLLVLALLALGWYLMMAHGGSGGNGGMMVEATEEIKQFLGCLKTCRRLSI
ncbi:MAG: hypothetical protein HFI93_00385 [Lachnospiraceae bacterium]|nr:hypothetical protein [Lachnospiraceae bacterium]